MADFSIDKPILLRRKGCPISARWLNAKFALLSIELGLEAIITTHAWRWFTAQAALTAGCESRAELD